MAKTDLTAQRLRELLHYSPETGVFTWLIVRQSFGGKAKAGKPAGYFHDSGHIRIGIEGAEYFAHRLVWLYMFNSFPVEQIDHINGNRSDNRFDNLREVPNQKNCENRRKSAKPGHLIGTTFKKNNNKWVAQIKRNYEHIYIGIFDTQEEAHEAYLAEKRRIHRGCTI